LAIISFPTLAIPIVGTPLDVTWDVSHNAITDLFQYRYYIENTGAAAIVNGVRLTVAEDPVGAHAGLHHEVNFLDDGGLFQYDRPKPAFPFDNYDWRDLDIAAGGTITLGFDDIHGPTSAPWEIEFGAVSNTNFVLGMPVPFVGNGLGGLPGRPGGGLGEICVVTALGDDKCYRYEGSVAVPDPFGLGFDYLKFLRNTGGVSIGPDIVAGVDNHADHWEAEHLTHAGIHHEVFPLVHPLITDNGCATGFGVDAVIHIDGVGAIQVAAPPPHNYFWHGLGDGGGGVECIDGDWDIGSVITVGFIDPHPPALTPWGGVVVGSEGRGFFDDPSLSPVNPAPTIPEPATLLLLTSSLVALAARRRTGGLSKPLA
jgi:hypothetical protein